MNNVKCFEVFGHSDTTEGRGPMKVVARFSNYTAASEYVKSKEYSKWCVMGYQSPNDINNIKPATIIILDSVDELAAMTQEALKAQALAKLTQAEKEALGVE